MEDGVTIAPRPQDGPTAAPGGEPEVVQTQDARAALPFLVVLLLALLSPLVYDLLRRLWGLLM